MSEPATIVDALHPVLDDLERCHPGLIRVEVADPEDDMAAWFWASDGTGAGIWRRPFASWAEAVVTVADQLQEVVVESLPGIGRRACWPICPQHPRTHPLTASGEADRAVWRCPVTGDIADEIGSLTPMPGEAHPVQ